MAKGASKRRAGIVDRTARDAAVDFIMRRLRGDAKEGEPVPASKEDAAFDMSSESEEMLFFECHGRGREQELRELLERHVLLLASDDPYQERPKTELRYWPFCDRESLIRAWDWAAKGKGLDLRHPDAYPSREKRQFAAVLLRSYLHGHMSMRQVRKRWPDNPFETILDWGRVLALDSLPGRWIASIRNRQRQAQIRELIARCGRFLEMDEAYTWPNLGKDYLFWPFLSFLALTFGSPVVVYLILSPLRLFPYLLYRGFFDIVAGACFLVLFGVAFLIAGIGFYRRATRYRRFFQPELAEWPFPSQPNKDQ
jgi:hypothetical protein